MAMDPNGQSCGCGAADLQKKVAELRVQLARTNQDNGATASSTPPIAGVGSPGWESQCGIYRGFAAQAPYWPEVDGPGGMFCVVPGLGGECTSDAPMGGWKEPFEIATLPAHTVGAYTEVDVALYTTFHAVIKALSFFEVYNATTGAPLTPTGIRIGGWSTQRKKDLFPGWGKETQAVIGTTYTANLQNQNPSEVFRPITEFTEQVLLNGQNNLPPMMARVDTMEAQTGFKFKLRYTISVPFTLGAYSYIAYNSAKKVTL